MTSHFLRPGFGDKPFEVSVTVVKRGRTLTNLTGVLEQDGKPRLIMTAAYGDLSQGTGLDTTLQPQELDLPPPDECPLRSGDTQGIHLPILERLEVRLHPEQAKAGTYPKAEVSGWIRFTDDTPPDTQSLPLFADAFPPSPFALLGVVGWVPTLELTVHVRARPAPGWIKARFLTEDLNGGRMIESGCLWDSENRLVAQSRQLGLVNSRESG